MFDVRFEKASDLTESELRDMPNNGVGKEWARYLRVVNNGKTILLKSDACEREDANFMRDYRWIKNALLDAYELGGQDARKAGYQEIKTAHAGGMADPRVPSTTMR